MTDTRKETARKLRTAFECAGRNGRWGTCGACPKDGAGRVLPELCVFTDRFDHQLTIDDLACTFKKT